jgi:hypothetical protein
MQYDTQTANSTSRYSDAQDAAVRVPEVLAEAQGLGEAIEYLGKHVAELEQRFAPVLQPVKPEPANAEGQQGTPDPSTPHALELHRFRLRVDYIAEHVRHITRRCEC